MDETCPRCGSDLLEFRVCVKCGADLMRFASVIDYNIPVLELGARSPAPTAETPPDRWATLVTEGEATGCYPCDTCNGFRAKGRPCQTCLADLTHRELDAPRCDACHEPIPVAEVYRCLDCGLPYHRDCLRKHCEHDLAVANERIAVMSTAECPSCAASRLDAEKASAASAAASKDADRWFTEQQKAARALASEVERRERAERKSKQDEEWTVNAMTRERITLERAEAAEASLSAMRDAARRVADEWEREAQAYCDPGDCCASRIVAFVAELRRALAPDAHHEGEAT